MDKKQILDNLYALQSRIRDVIVRSHGNTDNSAAAKSHASDVIYKIDADVEPVIDTHMREWSKTVPLVLIAEGIEDQNGVEGKKVYPEGSREEDAVLRIIMDPIDGTRGIMYDKRSAWSLAGVAPNKGDATRLRDIQVAVMTELPTSKAGFADVLWAVKGEGAHAERINLQTLAPRPLPLAPSKSDTIIHGFAMIANFFPDTKHLGAELLQYIARHLMTDAELARGILFDDQYISTGGQFYEIIVGHDRFNADLRPCFYEIINKPPGLCCHPYDCATLLIAEEAGILVTDGMGNPLDGPLDCTTGLNWAAFANPALKEKIEPLIMRFLSDRRVQ